MINGLSFYTPNNTDIPPDETCAICFEELRKDGTEEIVTHPAPASEPPKDFLHKNCVRPWLKRQPNCPKCRVSIDPSSMFSFRELGLLLFQEKIWKPITSYCEKLAPRIEVPLYFNAPLAMKTAGRLDSHSVSLIFGNDIDLYYTDWTFSSICLCLGIWSTYKLTRNIFYGIPISQENRIRLLATIIGLSISLALAPSVEAQRLQDEFSLGLSLFNIGAGPLAGVIGSELCVQGLRLAKHVSGFVQRRLFQ